MVGYHLMAVGFVKGDLQAIGQIEHAKCTIDCIPSTLVVTPPMQGISMAASVDAEPLTASSNGVQAQASGLLLRRERQAHLSEPAGSQTGAPCC